MINKTIFKAYDIRGVYSADMNDNVATVVARACAHMFDEGEVIIAYDARHGSTLLAHSAAGSLRSEAAVLRKNITVREVGMTSTPMFYYLVNHFKASGGFMITASHNPKNYNGMKVVKTGAQMIPGVEILKFITEHNFE